MALVFATVVQAGSWNGAAWTLPDGLGLVAFGGANEAWIVVDADSVNQNIISGLTLNAGTLFVESGPVDVLVYDQPLRQDFVGAIGPTSRRLVETITISFLGPLVTTPLTLNSSNGTATFLGALIRAAGARDSLGRSRVAVGLRGTGFVGGSMNIHTPLAGLRANVSGPYTGDSKLVGTAGADRAVECPRCGNLVLDSNLVRDGVQKGLMVCPECYDPPMPPSNWRFPFRA